jgi:hypothetical protein
MVLIFFLIIIAIIGFNPSDTKDKPTQYSAKSKAGITCWRGGGRGRRGYRGKR